MGVSNKQLMSSGSNANNDVVVVYEKAIDRGLVQKTLEQQGQILKTGNNSDTSGRGDSLTCSSSPPRNDQLTLPPTYQNATMFRNTSIRDNPSQISGAINPYQIHPSTLRNFQITKNFASLNNKNNIDRKISKSSRVKQLNNKFHQDLQNFEKEVKKLSLDRDLSDISPVSQSLNSNSENSQTSPDTGRETHESSESQKNSQNSTTKLKIQKSMLPPKNPRKQQVDLNVSQISASCNENCLTDGHSDNCWLNSTQPSISANPFLRGRNNHSNS